MPRLFPFQRPPQTFQQKGLADSWQSSDLAGDRQKQAEHEKQKKKGTIISIHHLQSCVSNVVLLSFWLQLGGLSLIALCE